MKRKHVELHLFWDNRRQKVVSMDDPGDLIVGTACRADVRLEDPNVSFIHCLLRMTESCQCFVKDLNSTNGTKLNGRLVDGLKPLFSGDLIQFGYITMLYLTTNGKQERTAHAS